ncbi:hypothetical protein FB45DRAFT_926584 [Roridomyces roridus]|uniref:Uncharacterized protein n=1 Tax=Roridomyces roridus TaxID=1738132 RepID=A0AAD7BKL3_9AGAR|nr:hypothetical protein FB45DRAFT_926584 [Roridomyces roridus]
MQLMLAFRTEVGSRQLVWAALADENEFALRGEYISGSCVKEVSDFVLSPDGKKAEGLIWEDTLDILNKVDPRVSEIVMEFLSSKA